MDEFLAPIAKRVKDLWTAYTTARAAKLDNLDAAISAISAVRSIQYGNIGLTGATLTNTATVTAVTVAKTFLIPLGVQANSVATAADPGAHEVRLSLTNTTTVTAERSEPGGIVSAGFCLVELK